MRSKITEKQLQYLVDEINRATGSPMVPWSHNEPGPGHHANIGNYHLSFAYGGVCLNRMMNEHGGVNCPLGMGHGPKRELYEKMRAFLDGMSAAKAA